MKKLFAIILSVVFISVMTACDTANDHAGSSSSDTQVTNANGADSADGQSNQTKNIQANQPTQSRPPEDHVQTPSEGALINKTTNQSTKNRSSQTQTKAPSKTTAKNNNSTPENTDDVALKQPTSEKINVPENMKLLGTDQAKEENNANTVRTSVVLYQLDGNVVNWITERDLIYIITSGNNRLFVINSKTMAPILNIPLAGEPGEINLFGDKIYISLPDLCRVDIFSKSNFSQLSSLYFQHEISSFCIDGNYVYYSEHDQHCNVFRKNLITDEVIRIPPGNGSSFYEPKLYLNKEDNILCIGETSCSGCGLYYYDATTLQLKSRFKKNGYGIMNHTRDIFHVGNDIFWGNYRFSDTDAAQILGRYGTGDYGSVNFASGELVSTFEGIFLTDTYECIVNYFDARFTYEYLLVTDSYNVFFRKRGLDANIIVGVNF